MSLKHAAARLVDRIRSDIKAVSVLSEWLGDGGIPVTFDKAELRAATCVNCPKNKPNSRKLENSVAEAIRRHESVRNNVQLRTSVDVRLFNCESCGCYLKLKVWVPTKNIEDAADQFPSNCWIKKEKNPPSEAVFDAQTNLESKPSTGTSSARKEIRIRRENAFGDVIQATVLASKMHALGYDVLWRCSDAVRECLIGHPHIKGFLNSKHALVDVDLDDTYEGNLERRRKSLSTLFHESAVHQLKSGGFLVPSPVNSVPFLELNTDEIDRMNSRLSHVKRPLIAFVPGSASWPSRRLSSGCVDSLPLLCEYTIAWSYPTEPPKGYFDPKIESFRDLMALIFLSDLVVTTDTGPLHVAAALNKEIIVIEQSIQSDLRLSMQTDWKVVKSGLECSPCNDFNCRIEKEKPPCQEIDPESIANQIRKSIGPKMINSVSVVIPVYKNHPRLTRCIESIPNVFETVIALDGQADLPDAPDVVKSTGKRIGFGKTCMRGVNATHGKFILFLNDDCYLNTDTVDHMMSTMESHPNCAVVGAQLWYENGTIQHGGTFTKKGDVGFGHIDFRKSKPTITVETKMQFVTFACALVRRSALFQVRGFDEEFDTYCEDSDLCIRLAEKGWEIWYNPNAKAIHEESQSTGQTKVAMHSESEKIFRRKWAHKFLK